VSNAPRLLTVFEHLDELRQRLLISLGALLVGTIGGYICSEEALRFVLKPIVPSTGELYFFKPQEAFVIRIKMALLLGAIAAAPVIISQLWLFVSPAMFKKEKKAILPFAAVTTVLFLIGAWFCYALVLPVALHFLLGMQSDYLKPMISASEYLSFLSFMVLAFGVAFDVPVFLVSLVLAGVTSAAALAKARRSAIVVIFIAAAILTPGPDIASQLLLAIPLLFLFEISILAARILDPKRKKTTLLIEAKP
jgi:sec-independent protein translocase protein TatC